MKRAQLTTICLTLCVALCACGTTADGARKARNFCASIKPGEDLSTIESKAVNAGAIREASGWEGGHYNPSTDGQAYIAVFYVHKSKQLMHVCKISSSPQSPNTVASTENMTTPIEP